MVATGRRWWRWLVWFTAKYKILLAMLCLMGTQLPLPQRDTAPDFQRMSVVAKQLDCWMDKVPLGTKVGLGPDHIYLL